LWPKSASEIYWPSDGRLSPQLMPTFADSGCCVVRAADPYGRILDFLDRLVSHYRMIIRSSRINRLVLLNTRLMALFCGSLCYRWHRSWSSSYGRQSVYQFVLVSGSPLRPMTRFYPLFLRLKITLLFFLGRPLWWEDGSVTYSAIADWSGHWGPITILYRLIRDCVPFLSPLTTRKDCGGGILARLHTGNLDRWHLVASSILSLLRNCVAFRVYANIIKDFTDVIIL
jgi:hypothetical protein